MPATCRRRSKSPQPAAACEFVRRHGPGINRRVTDLHRMTAAVRTEDGEPEQRGRSGTLSQRGAAASRAGLRACALADRRSRRRRGRGAGGLPARLSRDRRLLRRQCPGVAAHDRAPCRLYLAGQEPFGIAAHGRRSRSGRAQAGERRRLVRAGSGNAGGGADREGRCGAPRSRDRGAAGAIPGDAGVA